MDKNHSFDIDIDVNDSFPKEDYGIRAMIYNKKMETVNPHPSGYYVNSVIPVDRLTGNAAIDYEEAEDLGFTKIDLLTNSSYGMFKTKEEVLHYFNMEPNWEMFKRERFIRQLPHLSDHVDFVMEVGPTSIIEIADILALIRPGKVHLIETYLEDKKKARVNLYRIPKKGIYFKKSHAIAYACMVVTIANKIYHDAPIRTF